METRAKRFSHDVTAADLGPTNYDTLNYKSKESHNYGKVAFGSHSNINIFDGSRRPSFMPKV